MKQPFLRRTEIAFCFVCFHRNDNACKMKHRHEIELPVVRLINSYSLETFIPSERGITLGETVNANFFRWPRDEIGHNAFFSKETKRDQRYSCGTGKS